MDNCLFCNFAKTDAEVKKIYEDENFYAINDINPKAPIHIICIPKKHLSKIENQLNINKNVFNNLISFAHSVARQERLDKKGYQLRINYSGYNHLDHEHIHLLSGFIPRDV